MIEFLPPDTDPDGFSNMVSEKIGPDAEKTMRTLRDVWIDQGIAQGEARGELLAIRSVLLARFGSEAEDLFPRIALVAEPERLLRIAAIAATTESLDAFARELRDG